MADLSLPMFRAAVLKGNPALTDNDITGLYRINAPKLVDLDPMSQMKAALEIGSTTNTNSNTDTAPEDTDLGVPKRVALNTQVKDPYSDTTQAAKNPNNPGASGLSQFDPDQSNAANDEYRRRLRAMQPGRDVSDWATSMAGGTSPEVHRAFYQDQEALAKDLSVGQQARLQAQATAGNELAGKMQEQSMDKGKYETEQSNAQIEQANKRSDLVTKELTTAQQQRLDDPNSIETAMAKEIAKAHLGTAVPEKAAALTNIINQPGVTARQLILATGTLAPEAQKALMTAAGIKKTDAETPGVAAESAIKQGVANKVVGTSTPEGMTPATTQPQTPGPVVPSGQTISISDTPMSDPAYKQLQEVAKTDPGAANFLAAYDAKFNPAKAQNATPEERAKAVEQSKQLLQQFNAETDPAKKQAYMQQISALTTALQASSPNSPKPTLSGDAASKMDKFGTISAGGVTIPANPANAVMAGNDADAIEKANRQVEIYTQAQPAIKALRKALAETGSGKGTDLWAKLYPGQEREVVNLMSNFNAMYPGMLGQIVGPEMAKSIDKGGFTGAAVTNMSTDQMTRFLDMVDSQVATAKNSGDRRKQNVDNNTPGAVAPMPVEQKQPGAATKQARPPTISTADQYKALPSGATFVDARDGVTKRKP